MKQLLIILMLTTVGVVAQAIPAPRRPTQVVVGGVLTGVGVTVTITAPTSSTTYDAGTSSTLTTLAGTATSDRTLTSCTWTNSLGGSGTATGTLNWSVSSIALTVGSNLITVTCTYPNGGTGSDSVTVTRSSSSGGTSIFDSGWESAATTTALCTNAANDPPRDAGLWNDYGPGASCGTPPIVRLDTVEFNAGARSLRVHFKDGDGSNGPDFRINKVFSSPSTRTNLYYRWYQKWDSNWRWASADHKLLIAGSDAGPEQNIYMNVIAGSSSAIGRYIIGVQSDDTVFGDPGSTGNIPLGAWNCFEVHIIAGASGQVEAKLNGSTLTLVKERGSGSSNPLNVNTGTNLGYFKIDTTYNDFAFFEANVVGNESNTYYDSVRVCTGDWCGCTATVAPAPAPDASSIFSFLEPHRWP